MLFWFFLGLKTEFFLDPVFDPFLTSFWSVFGAHFGHFWALLGVENRAGFLTPFWIRFRLDFGSF